MTHKVFSTCVSSEMGFLYFFFITFHAFSIGLRSGELPGHSKVDIFSSDKPLFHKFCSVCGGIIMHKMCGLMDAPKRQQVTLQNLEVVRSPHCGIFG